jgi:hypothetical protein
MLIVYAFLVECFLVSLTTATEIETLLSNLICESCTI